jgi:8-oxo-dGTP diphosphatase
MTDRQLFRVHASVVVISANKVLLVQEEKPSNHGRWNLPGGHVDHGEVIPVAAARELREETGLNLKLAGLVGLYSSTMAVRFVFRADGSGHSPVAGHEILAVRWFNWDEVRAMKDDDLVSPQMLRMIGDDVVAGKRFDLNLFCDSVFTPQKPKQF